MALKPSKSTEALLRRPLPLITAPQCLPKLLLPFPQPLFQLFLELQLLLKGSIVISEHRNRAISKLTHKHTRTTLKGFQGGTQGK